MLVPTSNAKPLKVVGLTCVKIFVTGTSSISLEFYLIINRWTSVLTAPIISSTPNRFPCQTFITTLSNGRSFIIFCPRITLLTCPHSDKGWPRSRWSTTKYYKSNSTELTGHRLTLPKGVYSIRCFLYPMRIPNLEMHILT